MERTGCRKSMEGGGKGREKRKGRGEISPPRSFLKVGAYDVMISGSTVINGKCGVRLVNQHKVGVLMMCNYYSASSLETSHQ